MTEGKRLTKVIEELYWCRSYKKAWKTKHLQKLLVLYITASVRQDFKNEAQIKLTSYSSANRKSESDDILWIWFWKSPNLTGWLKKQWKKKENLNWFIQYRNPFL